MSQCDKGHGIVSPCRATTSRPGGRAPIWERLAVRPALQRSKETARCPTSAAPPSPPQSRCGSTTAPPSRPSAWAPSGSRATAASGSCPARWPPATACWTPPSATTPRPRSAAPSGRAASPGMRSSSPPRSGGPGTATTPPDARSARRSTASASSASTCTSSTGRTRGWASTSTRGARWSTPGPTARSARSACRTSTPTTSSASSTRPGRCPPSTRSSCTRTSRRRHFPQERARALHRQLGIRTQSWSPLGLGGRATLAAEPVTDAARRHGATPAQVVLRWHQQLGCLPIPRSSDPERQRENLRLGRLQLDEDELRAITSLGRSGGRLWGGDPETEER